MTQGALVIFGEGFEEVEAVTPVDLLRRAGIDVTTAGVGGRLVNGAHGISLSADREFSPQEGAGFDALILPGGPGTRKLKENGDILALVRRYHEGGKLIGAICAAPTILLRAGVLEGRRFTCFPACEEEMAGAGHLLRDPVVVDGKLITSRGAGTAIPFALALITALRGAGAAEEIARAIIYQE